MRGLPFLLKWVRGWTSGRKPPGTKVCRIALCFWQNNRISKLVMTCASVGRKLSLSFFSFVFQAILQSSYLVLNAVYCTVKALHAMHNVLYFYFYFLGPKLKLLTC